LACSCNHCVFCTRRKREMMRALRRRRSPWALSVRHWIDTYLGYPRAASIADAAAPSIYRLKTLA